jgi:hypothetical protein
MTNIEEFEFWCGAYRDDPHMADSEVQRLLEDMCARHNQYALAYVESLRFKEEANARRPELGDLRHQEYLAEEAVAAAVATAAGPAPEGPAGYPPNWYAISNAAKDRRGWRCEVCQFEKYGSGLIQVHHVDGDKADNSSANLQVLCARCHGDKHQTQSLWPPGTTETEKTELMIHGSKWRRSLHQ